MGKSALRGLLGSISVVVFLYALLISTYFNYNSSKLIFVSEFIFPLGCSVIAALFIDKERMSKFFISAAVYVIASLGLVIGLEKYGLLKYIYRIFYGISTDSPYDEQRFTILIMAGAAALLGIFIACVISIVNTIRIKKLIDSLEEK